MRLILATVAGIVLAAAAVACSDSEDGPGSGPTQPAASSPQPTSTVEPGPAPTDTPAPPQPTPAVPDPTPTSEPPDGGVTTGDPALDAIIRAALDGDAQVLQDFVAMTEAPCTTAQGAGGPPKCSQAPGSPPDGTVVEAFPASSCELGWTADPAPVLTQFATLDMELFAVLELDLGGPLFGEPYMPELDYAVILESESPAIGRLGHMVGVQDGAIVYLENLCGGAPETYLTERQQIAEHHQVLLQGPAFRQ